jgi:hypothetical protein
MTENIAEKIRADCRPEGEKFAMSGEAKRLRRALAVAEKWIDAAWKGEETGHLTATAETTRDQLEERLPRHERRGRSEALAPPSSCRRSVLGSPPGPQPVFSPRSNDVPGRRLHPPHAP